MEVPVYHPDVQQGAGGLGEIASPEKASIQDAAIAHAGAGLSDLGGALIARDQAEEKTRRQLKVAEFSNFVTQVADDAKDHAINNAKADGSDVVPLFQDYFDKQVQPQIKNETDSLLADYYNTKSGFIRNRYRGKLEDASRLMAKNDFTDRANQLLQTATAQVYRNPMNYDEMWQNYSDFIGGSVMTDANKTLALENGKKALARSVIESYVTAASSNGDNAFSDRLWTQAKSSLIEKFGGDFSEKERNTLMDHIMTEQIRTADLANKRSVQAANQAKRDQQAQQDLTLRTRIAELQGIRDLPGPQGVQAMQQFQDGLATDVMLGKMTKEQMDQVSALSQKTITKEQAGNLVPLYNRLGTDENMGQLRKDVLAQHSAGLISSQSTVNLLNAISAEERRQEERNKSGQLTKDPLVKNAIQAIRNSVGWDPTHGFAKQENGALYAQMMNNFLVNLQAGYGRQNPLAMANNIIKKYQGSGATYSGKYFQLINSDDPQKALQETYKRATQRPGSKGAIDKGEAADIMKQLQLRIKQNQDKAARKNGTNP